MRVKQYEAENMPEVLRMVRRDMGDQAVILQTRHTRPGFLRRRRLPVWLTWLADLSRKEQVRVLAALDETAAASVSPGTSPMAADVGAAARACPSAPAAPVARCPAETFRADRLERLVASGMERETAAAILAELGTEASDAACATAIQRRLTTPPKRAAKGCARIVLVGPTGVGKTTTAAKLAARYALTERKRVVLITMDTYRIGAVDQLRTYARVMGIPMEVAHSPEEVREAVARHADKDVILMDTVGRNPNQSLHLAELKTFLNAAEPTETHLVLSATSGTKYLARTARQFASLDTDRLIMTKLDEMPAWGILPELVQRTGLPLAFVADGQEVPRHLRTADPSEIALRVMGGAS